MIAVRSLSYSGRMCMSTKVSIDTSAKETIYTYTGSTCVLIFRSKCNTGRVHFSESNPLLAFS